MRTHLRLNAIHFAMLLSLSALSFTSPSASAQTRFCSSLFVVQAGLAPQSAQVLIRRSAAIEEKTGSLSLFEVMHPRIYEVRLAGQGEASRAWVLDARVNSYHLGELLKSAQPDATSGIFTRPEISIVATTAAGKRELEGMLRAHAREEHVELYVATWNVQARQGQALVPTLRLRSRAELQAERDAQRLEAEARARAEASREQALVRQLESITRTEDFHRLSEDVKISILERELSPMPQNFVSREFDAHAQGATPKEQAAIALAREVALREVNTEVEPPEGTVSIGPIQMNFVVTQLKMGSTSEVVGVQVHLSQSGGAKREGRGRRHADSEASHFASEAEARRAGIDVGADVSWSTSLTLDFTAARRSGQTRPEILGSPELYMEWSGW
ncbi:MAG TPA: hypothetical protein PLZ57_05635 [Pseudobdellovibrionaceae bacterium]|nr:hypothetical protein [Pseudobdellovibrionaceae bacterium]